MSDNQRTVAHPPLTHRGYMHAWFCPTRWAVAHSGRSLQVANMALVAEERCV
jgi:hypothetical protein